MSFDFRAEVEEKAKRRNRAWYMNNLMKVMDACKDKQVRGIDGSIALARELINLLNEKVDPPAEVPPRVLIPSEDDRLMNSIEQEILDILYKSTQKGAVERYLKARNKKAPEDKYVFRLCGNWDYGWKQKESRVRPRDFLRGRCAILRDTFYRKNNLAPDPPHYAQPSGGEIGICSQYSCNFG